MKLAVKNFGPIKETLLDVKPLTILTGPNAVGKSYLLYLLWTLLEAEPNWIKLGEQALKTLQKVSEAVSHEDYVTASEHIKRFYTWFTENMGVLIEESLEELLKETFLVSPSIEIK